MISNSMANIDVAVRESQYLKRQNNKIRNLSLCRHQHVNASPMEYAFMFTLITNCITMRRAPVTR